MTEKSNERAASETKVGSTLVMAPPVDVYEDESGITLYADMPGVSKESLNVRVDGDTLLIEGETDVSLAANLEPVYVEVRGSHYRRSFTLSRELARDQIDARLEDGVLVLRIPKARQAQPQRIQVRVG